MATSRKVSRWTAFKDLPEFLTPEELQDYLSLSKNSVYELIKSGGIASQRFGRLIRIPKVALQPAERM